MQFLAAIHGINTGLTNPSWPWKLQAYAVRKALSVVFQCDHYWTSAFPIYNNLILNKRQGKAVSRRLALLAEEFPQIPVSLVAHSNGTNIAVNAVKRLAREGIKVDSLLLISSAVDSDIAKNGLLELVEGRMLNRAVAYCTHADNIIRPLHWFPGLYGSLGTQGWQLHGKPTGLQLLPDASAREYVGFYTRWFPDFSHSAYFEDEHIVETFDLIRRDIGLDGGRNGYWMLIDTPEH